MPWDHILPILLLLNDICVFLFQMAKPIVCIEDMHSVADVTFPAVAQVKSLLIDVDASTTENKERPLLVSHLHM